jgi:hypothetical protein
MKFLMQIFEQLQAAGWHVALNETQTFNLPEQIQNRYPRIPFELSEFLSILKFCTNPNQTAWFLCESDFYGSNDSAYRWNEFELMELELAAQDNDSIWKSQTQQFWDNHFPFLLSVKTGYAFFAVDLHAENYGAIVHGLAPEFREVSEVAKSFQEFLNLLSLSLQRQADFFEADL